MDDIHTHGWEEYFISLLMEPTCDTRFPPTKHIILGPFVWIVNNLLLGLRTLQSKIPRRLAKLPYMFLILK